MKMLIKFLSVLFLLIVSFFSSASNEQNQRFEACKKMAQMSEFFVKARLSGKTKEEVEAILINRENELNDEDIRLVNLMLRVSFENDFERDPATMSNQHKDDFARLAHLELLINCYELKEQGK